MLSNISVSQKLIFQPENFGMTADYLLSLKKLVWLFGGLRKLLDMSTSVPKVKEPLSPRGTSISLFLTQHSMSFLIKQEFFQQKASKFWVICLTLYIYRAFLAGVVPSGGVFHLQPVTPLSFKSDNSNFELLWDRINILG